MSSDRQAAPPEGEGRKAIWLARLEKLYSGSVVIFWPFTDLATRFFVATAYLKSAWVKAFDWDRALLLATHEYPVEWLAAHHAAVAGLAIELVAGAFLLIGLFTRPSALALAVLTIIAQIEYIPTTTNLMLIAMLGWYFFNGAAAISIDAVWVRRLANVDSRSITALIRLGSWLRRNIAPLVILAIRVWLGIALLALAEVFEPSILLATWLPVTSFTGLPPWCAILFAVLLISGTAASPVSYVLALLIAAFMIAGTHPDVTFYPVLLLGVYEARGAGPLSIDNAVDRWFRGRFGRGAARPVCPDDPQVWLATLRQWWIGSRVLANKALTRQARRS